MRFAMESHAIICVDVPAVRETTGKRNNRGQTTV
jgi:hypothetical protein